MLKYTRAWKIERFLDLAFPPGMIYFSREFFALETTAYVMKTLPFGALRPFKIKIILLSCAKILESSYPNSRSFNSSVAVNESSYWNKSFFLLIYKLSRIYFIAFLFFVLSKSYYSRHVFWQSEIVAPFEKLFEKKILSTKIGVLLMKCLYRFQINIGNIDIRFYFYVHWNILLFFFP